MFDGLYGVLVGYAVVIGLACLGVGLLIGWQL